MSGHFTSHTGHIQQKLNARGLLATAGAAGPASLLLHVLATRLIHRAATHDAEISLYCD